LRLHRDLPDVVGVLPGVQPDIDYPYILPHRCVLGIRKTFRGFARRFCGDEITITRSATRRREY
jgi:hypothetical protein